MTPDEFRAKWRTEAEAMHRRSAMVTGAGLCTELLADFDAVMSHQANVEVGLSEAVRTSNYSGDHLRRLYRAGKLPGRREGRRLLFRLADLPRKPDPVATEPPTGYDPVADARQVATRRNRGVGNG
jgi:hypothetical protein